MITPVRALRRALMLFLLFPAVLLPCDSIALAAEVDEAPGTYGAEEDKEQSFSTGTRFFDDANFSGGAYFMMRDRRRKDLNSGNYNTNLEHSSIQGSAEINSGFIGDFIGADFGAFGSHDIHNGGSIDHEMNFVPWRDPWHMDWSKTHTQNAASVYKPLAKAKAGPAWARASAPLSKSAWCSGRVTCAGSRSCSTQSGGR